MHVGRRSRGGETSGLRTSTTTGQVWSDIVLDADGTRVISIFFAPGSRTYWHRHPGGQFIYTIAGEGWIRTREGAFTMLEPGDVVWCPPGEEHWHGATQRGFVMQVAVHFGDVDWGSPVTDSEYGEAG